MNLNTDKLIRTFLKDVQEEIKEDFPNDATEILKKLEDRCADIAYEGSYHRRPSKEDLLRSFGSIYWDVRSDYSKRP